MQLRGCISIQPKRCTEGMYLNATEGMYFDVTSAPLVSTIHNGAYLLAVCVLLEEVFYFVDYLLLFVCSDNVSRRCEN
jgi:hypothetical protein